MGEINKNINNLNFQTYQKPKIETNAIPEKVSEISKDEEQNDCTMELKDLSAMPAATLGKSQISSDNIENDMKYFAKYPKLVHELTTALDEYAKTHTGEETMMMFEKTYQEFVNKK